jgi:hypothetical protein
LGFAHKRRSEYGGYARECETEPFHQYWHWASVNKPRAGGSSTLVSTTARTPPALGANRFHLPIDLFHRHRLDTGFGHALRDRQKRSGRLPALELIAQQPFDRLRCQELASRAARAVTSDSSI